jgi:hypothetical protein
MYTKSFAFNAYFEDSKTNESICKICVHEKKVAEAKVAQLRNSHDKEIEAEVVLKTAAEDIALADLNKRQQLLREELVMELANKQEATLYEKSTMTPHSTSVPRGSRLEGHLRSQHNIKDAKELAERLQSIRSEPDSKQKLVQPTLAASLLATREFNARECATIYHARKYHSFSDVEDVFFKKLVSMIPTPPPTVEANGAVTPSNKAVIINRRAARRDVIQMAAQLELEVCSSLFYRRFVTLAIDSGTVWTRCLATVVHAQCGEGRSLLFDLRPDWDLTETPRDPDASSDEDEADVSEVPHLTSEKMKVHVQSLIDKLEAKPYCCFVIAVCTDNASSMVGLSRMLNRFDVRCACHGIQLLVNVVLENDPDSMTVKSTSETFLKNVMKLTPAVRTRQKLNNIQTPCTTRWNGWLELIRNVQTAVMQNNHIDNTSTTRTTMPAVLVNAPQRETFNKFQSVIDLLRRFEIATNIVQGDAANIIDFIRAVGVLLFPFHHNLYHLKQFNDKFVERLLSAPLIVTAFFCRCHSPVTTGNLETLKKYIRAVIDSSASRAFCKTLNIDASTVLAQFEKFGGTAKPPRQANLYDGNAFSKDMDHYSSDAIGLSALMKWLNAIVHITCSEASAERVFRRLKLTIPKDRKRISTLASEACVKLNIMSQFFVPESKTIVVENRQRQESSDAATAMSSAPTNSASPSPRATSGAAAAAASSSGNNILDDVVDDVRQVEAQQQFHTAAVYIVEAAIKKLLAMENEDLEEILQPTKRKIARCTVHKTDTKTFREMKLRCTKCREYSCEDCVGVSAEDVTQDGWTCSHCQLEGCMPVLN